MPPTSPIGIFDSGFGGLTVLQEIERVLPSYDYLYLGDNARAPYSSVRKPWVGCHLVILACNTASAKALRTIQQNDLSRMAPDRRVLGVIRPVTESIGMHTSSGHVGILGTVGTVESRSYVIEIEKYFPHLTVTQEACPMWVPLVENGEADREGADYFVRQHIERLLGTDPLIDTVVLGCTHYPLLERKIRKYLHSGIAVVSQGAIVAGSLERYLTRHRELASTCSMNGTRRFFSSEKNSTTLSAICGPIS